MSILTTDIDQINALRMGVDYSFTVHLRQMSLTVRPLSMSETVRVTAIVAEQLTKVPPQARTMVLENSLIAKETLKLASTTDVGKSDYRISDLVMDHMTPDELQTLFKEYVANCDRVNPSLERMAPGDVQSLIDDLKKSPRTEDLNSRLTSLSLSQLRSLALYCLTKDE